MGLKMKTVENSFYDIIHAQAVIRPDSEAVVMGDVRLTVIFWIK